MNQQTIILVITGIVSGFLGGLLGIGGAIIIIPALVYLLGYSQTMAQGTSLVMLVMPVGILAAWQYYRNGNANINAAIILGITFFIASFIGARYANAIPQNVLRKLFAVLLIAVAFKMLFFDKAVK